LVKVTLWLGKKMNALFDRFKVAVLVLIDISDDINEVEEDVLEIVAAELIFELLDILDLVEILVPVLEL